MKNITKPISDNKACYEVVADCHKLLDEAEIEHLPDYSEGRRLIERLKLIVMRLTLRDAALNETLKRLAELSKTDDDKNERSNI